MPISPQESNPIWRSNVYRSNASFVFTISILLFLGSKLGATAYYVSPTGSDSNSGSSTSAPFQTIQYAVSLSSLAPGDTIILMDGTYGAPPSCTDPTHSMAVKITTGGTSANPITLKAMHKWAAVLDAQGLCQSYIFFQSSSASYWVIQDLEIKNGHYGGIWSNSNGSAQGVVITGNHIHDIGREVLYGTTGEAGIFVAPPNGIEPASSMVIEGNLIHDIGRTNDAGNSYDQGIYNCGGTATIVHNIFYNMWSGWGVQFAPGSQGTIANNTFYGPNGYGGGQVKKGQIMLWGIAAGAVNVQNNLFDLPYLEAIDTSSFALSPGVTCSIEHNLAYGVSSMGGPGPNVCQYSNNCTGNGSCRSSNPVVSPGLSNFQ